MNQKNAKALRRIARQLAVEDSNTAIRYKQIVHPGRKVFLGWREKEAPEQPKNIVAKAAGGILGLMKRAWDGLKAAAGRAPEPVQKPDPKEYEPIIETMNPTTDVLVGGIRFYLQRIKRRLGLAETRIQARAERGRRLAELALR